MEPSKKGIRDQVTILLGYEKTFDDNTGLRMVTWGKLSTSI